jgi:hypothetical protein
VREIVMVIADLYLPPDAAAAAPELAAAFVQVPGIESAGRFGQHAALPHGWREWLVERVGRTDLSGLAPACVVGAAHRAALSDASGTWIATPVHLRAGLTRVHLDHRGLLHLPPAEQTMLAADFRRTFGASSLSLIPLSSGEFLLSAPGIAPVATVEPARCAGGDVAEVLPHGPAAAPLRRLAAEIEMWLHGQALNEARGERGEPPVSALWLWGAEGRRAWPEPRACTDGQGTAFGSDCWLQGLWHLQGSACRALPEGLEEALAASDAASRVLLIAEAGRELQRNEGSLAQAVARLDERFVSPALRALRRGELASVTLIVNDARATLRRGSHLRLWRRRRAGLGSFA